jgi:ADP-heptose:LPS heptosyltransferase
MREGCDSITWSQRIRLRLVRAVYAGANTLLLTIQRILWPLRPAKTPQRICLYRIGNVGDVVCALPAMRAVRSAYPGARLVLLTSPGRVGDVGAREVLQRADWLDAFISYYATDISTLAGRWRFLRHLRREHIDLWLELPNNRASLGVLLRNMLLAKMAGARYGGGWRLSTVNLWPQLQSEFLWFPNEVDRLLTVVKEEGIMADRIEYGLLDGSHGEREAKVLLLGAGVSDDHRIVVIAPASKRTTNLWVTDRWVETGRALAARGYNIIVVGGSKDNELCQAICQGICEGAVNLAGQTEIPVLAALLRISDLVLCVDSGVQHIAAAVGARCVSLFSAWQHRGKWHPHGEHVIIEKPVSCHTCLLETCPYDNRCMREITVAEVVAACDQVIHKVPDRSKPRNDFAFTGGH